MTELRVNLSRDGFLHLNRYLKFLTWVNIFVQAAFPIAIAFTPAIAEAEIDRGRGQNQTQIVLQTRGYTLKAGESVTSVANKYNISLDALRKLNQLRTFVRGFDHLQPGDELDVPASLPPKAHLDDAPFVSTSGLKDDRQEQKWALQVASYASQFGGALGSDAGGDAAASMARGMASNAVGGEIQQWLSRFGTARVKLDADANFSLKNSQLDLLVPLFDQKDSLVFTQASIHRTDERAQSNFGFGYRWFADEWMLGANTFLDYDHSRGHVRMGLGGEYWRDFLKLGVNTYYSLTNWKDTPNLEDYEERPANGWDFRAQYWIPSLPQLGGKLTYEQYYGDEVALFGLDNRQDNPYAITAGVNYTPVPLLTFGAEKRYGQSGKSDTRFSVDMNYQLGVPWQQQVHPDSVAAMRSLVGSQHDLVERNNNIVLEYRKKDVISLTAVALVTGYAGEQKSLGVSVNSKYGLDRIDWSASSLIAAGGGIVQDGLEWNVVLPAYQSSSQTVNTYIVSGVAVDKKGNVSSRIDIQVTVTQAAIDLCTSSLSASSITLPADGVTKEKLVLKLNDKEGQPVDVSEEQIETSIIWKIVPQQIRGALHQQEVRGRSEVSKFTRIAQGEYEMTIIAGTLPERYKITPEVRGSHLPSADITIAADSSTALINALEVVEDNAIADGNSQNKFRVTVLDEHNNPVPNVSVKITADHGATVAASAITKANGKVIVPVTSQQAGEKTITASINDKDSKTLALIFRPDQNTARIEQKDFSVLPEVSWADGKTPKMVTARVTDEYGNAVPNILVTFSTDNGAVLNNEKINTDVHGWVTAALTSAIAGTSHVVASVNSQSASKAVVFIGETATAIVADVDAAAATGVADGTTEVTFKALVKDQNGNPLTGIPVDWKSNKDSSIVSFNRTQTLTSGEGIAEVQLTSTRAYSDVIVTASTNASSKSADPFTFLADKKNPVIKTLISNKQSLIANGRDMAELTVGITDTNGNPLSGVEVALSNGNRAEITPARLVTDANGVASASVTTRYAGQVTVSASLNEGGEKSLLLIAVPDEKTSGVTVTASSTSAIAGQAEPVVLTATVVDENNNPVSGTSVAWRVETSDNQLSDSVSQTDAEGKAKVQLTGTEARLTTVSAVLYNGKKGSIQVAFEPGEPVGEHSQLSVSPQSITADGSSKALVSLLLRDKWDNPVPNKTVDWHAETADINFMPIDKGDGLYQASVTGTVQGKWALRAQSGSVSLQVPLTLLANADAAKIASVQVSGADSAKADGLTAVTIRAQVKDALGNPVKGIAVGWSTTLGTLSSTLSHTDENGITEITLSSRVSGGAWVSAMLGGGSPVQADKVARFIAGAISPEKSSLRISPANIVADKERAMLTVTARDAEGNLLSGLADKINAAFTLDLNMTVSAFSEISSGVYEAAVSGKKAGSTQVSATVNGTLISQVYSLELRSNNDSAIVDKGIIRVTPGFAKVGETVTYEAVLTDANQNVLGAGVPVVWKANEGSQLSAPATRTDNSGTVRVTLKRELAGKATVSLRLSSGTTLAPEVTFSAGDVDENLSELTLSPSAIVAGKESAVLSVMLRDSYGNPLTGKSVSGYSDNSNVTVGKASEASDVPGRYTMAVHSNKIGSATLTVKVGDNTLNKSQKLTVKGDTDSWKLSAVTPDKTTMIAGDTAGVTYSATVTDANGNLLNNVVVSWFIKGQWESFTPTSRTNERGVATTTVKSNTAGLLQMTASLDPKNYLQADNVKVLAGDIKSVNFSANKANIDARGKDTVTLTATLKDSYGNPVTGKKVIIEGTTSLPGFTLSAVQDLQDGSYVATGTSTKKGKVTLNLRVDGKIVGNSVSVTADAVKLDLRFDNAVQPVIWTSKFAGSQAVRGLPEGLTQVWSSTDTAVATVDGSGKVTLLKSGKTRISVYTPGDDNYDPASAVYELDVSRADPGLKTGPSNVITAVWADSKVQNVTTRFANSDVQGKLKVSYSVETKEVVTVDATGKLTPMKPGTTTLSVTTPETDQFLAASSSIVYVLSKARADVNFKIPVVETTDEEKFTLQSLDTLLTPQASIKWTSSNQDVVNISDSGAIMGGVGKGQTRLTLSVLDNDYYTASSGYYDVMVYTKPSIHLGTVSYISKGSQASSGIWTPVYTDDSISATWSVDTAEKFSKAQSVILTILDSDGKPLDSKTITSPSGSITTTFQPKTSFWGKTIRVELVAKGVRALETKKSTSTISVQNLEPKDIWHSFIVKSVIRTYTSGGEDTWCKESHVGREHWNNVNIYGDAINFDGKTLLSPMLVKAQFWAHKNLGLSAEGEFPETYTISSSKKIAFGTKQIAADCWRSDIGDYAIVVNVNYAGKEHKYTGMKHIWDGGGLGMRVEATDIY